MKSNPEVRAQDKPRPVEFAGLTSTVAWSAAFAGLIATLDESNRFVPPSFGAGQATPKFLSLDSLQIQAIRRTPSETANSVCNASFPGGVGGTAEARRNKAS